MIILCIYSFCRDTNSNPFTPLSAEKKNSGVTVDESTFGMPSRMVINELILEHGLYRNDKQPTYNRERATQYNIAIRI
jgi:hypothetical protein